MCKYRSFVVVGDGGGVGGWCTFFSVINSEKLTIACVQVVHP